MAYGELIELPTNDSTAIVAVILFMIALLPENI